jgi:alpha-methylacyl-CoA racemase
LTTGALDGVRVLDMTRHVPGPYCTQLLGDLGADVVKIEEPPYGDPTRVVPPAAGDDSALHAALNRNKRSVLVDLRSTEGGDVVRRLALRADVLVEAFRPGVLARRGLGYEALAAENARLIYCSLSGYGQDGPLANRAGHDIDYIARSGLLGLNRDASGAPRIPAAPLADMAGGMAATIAILAALQARHRTGLGQRVDVSMFQSAMALLTMPLTRQLAGGDVADELSGAYACYNVYRCADDRWVAVGALEAKFWEPLCRALGLNQLIPRQWERADKRGQTVEAVARAFAARDRDLWLRELAHLETCVEPVLDLEEAASQRQAAALLMKQRAGEGWIRTLAPPFALGGTPASVRRPAPRPGEHASEVLAEAGYAPQDVDRLRQAGVVA